MQKKGYLILFLVIALVLGGWRVSSAGSAPAQWIPEQNTNECKSGADALVGSLAEIPRATNRVRQICEFNVRMESLDSQISDYDRQFIEQAIASNLLAIRSLDYALDRVENEEWQGLIEMMIAMHTHDLELAIDAADELGLDTMADLTSVRVYPGTPDYDLGTRTLDLVAKYLDPLMNAGGDPTATPTAIPTLNDTPTPLSTGVIVNTPTGVSTLGLTVTPTGGLSTAETTGTPATAESTGTPTPALTEDTTGTSTAALTQDATGTPATLPTGDLTGTPTVIPTLEMTGTTTSIPTDIVTGTPTPTSIPTDPGNEPDFDMVALHIIEELHGMQVQVALVAQRLVTNDEIRAFAKHTADMTQLHLLLMSDLKHRLFDSYVPPTPHFQREYQGPRRFEPAGE
jgi:hypothetical protein